MKRALVLSLITFSVNQALADEAPAAAAVVAAPVIKLTLEDSIAMAIKNGTSVLKAQYDRDLGGTYVLQSYLQFLPNLGTTYSDTKAKGKTFLATSTPTLVNAKNYGPNYSINSTLNLFNGFSDIAAWKIANERRNISEKTLTRAKEQITLDVAQSYLQVILDKKLVEIADKNFAASKGRQLLLEEQTKVGARNKSDLFRQQAQTSADENFLITTKNKFQDDQILLLRKLRLDLYGNYEFSDEALDKSRFESKEITNEFDEEKSIQQALSNRQDYAVSRLNAEISSHTVTMAQASYIPKLDFTANFLGSGRKFDYQFVNGVDVTPANQRSFNTQLKDQTNLVVGIYLTWNIFDRATTTLEVQKNRIAAKKADLDAEDFRNQVIGEVKSALNDYRVAIQQLKTSQQGLIAAQKAYEVSSGLYEVGSLNYIDLASAQTALVQAQAARAQAFAGYELQRRTVEFALGSVPE